VRSLELGAGFSRFGFAVTYIIRGANYFNLSALLSSFFITLLTFSLMAIGPLSILALQEERKMGFS
jgi:hypothetical protein